MDKYAHLVSRATSPVAILGNLRQEFELLDLNAEPVLPEQAKQGLHARDMRFCGVAGVVDGKLAVAYSATHEALATMPCAVAAYAERVAKHLRVPPQGDAVDWLDALYRLEDPRPNQRHLLNSCPG